jgi:hypothetical protein
MQGNKDGIFVPHFGGVMKTFGPYCSDFDPVINISKPLKWKLLSFADITFLKDASAITGRHDVKTVSGATYLLNCWRQRAGGNNPMHLLHKVANMYELAMVVLKRLAKGEMIIIPFFDQLALHQCASHDRLTDDSWELGTFLWKVGLTHWGRTGLWGSGETYSVVDLSNEGQNWVCFEELYVDRRYRGMGPPREFISSWKHDLLTAAKIYEEKDGKKSDGFQTRCETSHLRIHIFQRTPGDGKSGDRAFSNLNEVKELLQRYTEEPVKILTVHSGLSVYEQSKVFRSFDILVTPHGSHLMNMLFEPERTGIIEVAPTNHDNVFSHGSRHLGIWSYITSTGHHPVRTNSTIASCDTQSFEKHLNAYCKYDSKDGEGWLCPREWSFKWVVCDVKVNITSLRKQLEKTLSKLCKV